ncbi:DNRLRE domain-containing protein, partial [Candidatus Korarchaeum cryptofilum]
MKRALFLILLLLLTLLPYERGSAGLTLGAGGTLYIPMDSALSGVNITVNQSFSVTNFKVYTYADSYVNSGSTGTNYGSSTGMYFGNNSGTLYYAYMSFIYPVTNINGAIFRGTVTAGNRYGLSSYTDIGTFFVTRIWNENTITWSNKPTDTGSSLLTFRISYNPYDAYPKRLGIEFPSSSYSGILSMLANKTYYGIVLRPVSSYQWSYGVLATKERSAADARPYLQINGTINPLKWIYIANYNSTHLQVQFNGYYLKAKAIDSIWFRVTTPYGSSYVNASLSGTSYIAYLKIYPYFVVDQVTFKYG